MIQAHRFLQNLVIFGAIIPLAVILGYLATATPDLTTISTFAVVTLVLASPLLLRHHHSALVCVWNMSAVMFFLPGSAPLWLAASCLSFGVSAFQATVDRKYRFRVPLWLVWPLAFLLAVVFVTSYFRGGLGFGMFGGSLYGGKRYVYLVGAVLGFFALAAQSIPPHRANKLIALFFLGHATAFISNTVAWVSPNLYFLYLIFPPETTGLVMVGDQFVIAAEIFRSAGLSMVGAGFFYALLAVFGIRGSLDTRHPWRPALLLLSTALSTIGGFRSLLIFMSALFAALFILEGLHRTRWMAILLLVGGLTVAALIPTASKLPLSIQRTLSFLPLELDTFARHDAQASTTWRLEIWKVVARDIPQYLWLGKGFAINAAELEFLTDEMHRTGGGYEEVTMAAGDYHSGPLSLIIPLGIWGVLGAFWFWGAGLKALYQNFRYGVPSLKRINTFLLGFFVVRVLSFLFVFGSFYVDLMYFTGILGLSLSLNGGVRKRATAGAPVAQPTPLSNQAPQLGQQLEPSSPVA